MLNSGFKIAALVGLEINWTYFGETSEKIPEAPAPK